MPHDEAPKRKTHEETLQCGHRRCCPTVTVFEDGSMEISDDDAAVGSVGTIKLRPEVVKRLAEIAAGKL